MLSLQFGNPAESKSLPDLYEPVLERIRSEGPLGSRDFEGAGDGTDMWNWKPAKIVLEALWDDGAVSRFGPMVPVAFAGWKVWHVAQPFAANTAFPAAASPPPAEVVVAAEVVV